MLADEAFREGRLEEALEHLQAAIRRDAGNAKHRVFLFQLLALLGRWDRALLQLNVLADMDPQTLPMVHTYREALRCEALRADVFAGRRTPMLVGEPEPWVALLLEALRLGAEGRGAESQDLREQAFEAAPAVPGTLDGAPFEWIADADPRLGPMLEVITNGRYYWVPFGQIRSLTFEPPEDLRDLVWMPAGIMWAAGGETVGLVPTRYPGSEASDDSAIRMARRTEWEDMGDGLYLGLGQRLLVTDAGETPMLDVRRLTLEAPLPDAAGEAAAEAPGDA